MSRRVLVLHPNSPAAYPPLMHLLHLLLEASCTLRLIGATGADGLPLPATLVGRIDHVDLGRRTAGDRVAFGFRLLRAAVLALRWRPRLVVASDPDAAFPALLIAAVLGVPIAYIEHDSPSPESVLEGRRARRLLRRLLVGCAALRVFPNAGRLAHARGELGFPEADAVVMPNLPLRADVRRAPRAPTTAPRRLHYHGSINPWAVPLAVVPALVRRPGWRLDIYGYVIGHQAHLDALLRAAHEAGLGERLCFHGVRPHAELDALLAEADAALSGYRAHPFNLNHIFMDGASVKLNEYAAHGLPTLLSADLSFDQFPAELGIPYVYDDVESIVAALDRAEQRPPDRPGRVPDYATVCRERLLPRLMALLEAA